MKQLLYTRISIRRSQINHPIKNIFPKLIRLLQISKQRLNKLKHTNRRITQMIILLPNIMSQFQVTTETIIMKNHNLKHTNLRITQMIILLPKRTSHVQETTEMIQIKTKI